MEFDNSVDFQEEGNSENSKIDIRELIDKYLRHWKWFVLAFILSILLAFYNLNFTRHIYQATGTIKIKDEKGGDRSTLSAFQDLGVMPSAKDNIEDEIEILRSKSLLSEVVKSLNLNVKFFTNKNYISEFLDTKLGLNTEFYETEGYKDLPLKINFFISDSILYKTNAQFILTINSTNNYTFFNMEKSIEKRHAFGEKITTNFGDIIITPNTDLKKSNLIGKNVLVKINSIQNLTNSYLSNLEVSPLSQYSSIISLSLKDGVKQRSEDFLNELVRKYNQRAISLKEELSQSTSDFVSKRLEIISTELTDVDLTAESIKTRYGISDVASRTGLNMQSGQEIEKQIVAASTELQKIKYMKEYVSDKNDTELIPDLDVGDNNTLNFRQQYNMLMMDKKRILKNSTEKNPIVVNITEQLDALKNNFNQSLNNIESSQRISLDALNNQSARINSRLYSAPKQERQVRDIQRQQGIKETLFLYLLKKREETAITLGVADPNAIIIDTAESFPDAIAPKKLMAYLGTIIFGLLIPLLIIYLKDLLNSKIHTKEDIEKVLNIPIVADIPKGSKNRYLIKKDDYSSIAEAFRILRTNLNFILPSSKGEKGKTIFVTSTIAHEGKSFVATNLAAALAHAGKRTLILGMDIRAPKIEPYLGVRGKYGITNYIINLDLIPEDIIVGAPNINNLDVASSGDIAPNPAELLMNPRVKELFTYATDNYEYVIVDTAAYSMVTDTLLLSNFADAFIYVIRANFLDKRALKYIKSLYKDKRLPNMALLINGIDYKKAYGYGYGYGYGTDFDKSKKKWWKLGL